MARWCFLFCYYILVCITVFSTGHLLPNEIIRVLIVSIGLEAYILFARKHEVPSWWPFALLCFCSLFVVTQYDVSVSSLHQREWPIWWWAVLSYGVSAGLIAAVAIGSTAEGHRSHFRKADLLWVGIGVVLLVILVGTRLFWQIHEPGQWLPVAKVVQYMVVYLALVQAWRRNWLTGEGSSWHAIPRLLQVIALTLALTGILGVGRLWKADLLHGQGREFLAKNEVSVALPLLQDAADLSNYRSVPVLVSLGDTWFRSGKLTEGKAVLEDAYKLAAFDDDLKVQIGSIYVRFGYFDQGIAIFTELPQKKEAQAALLSAYLRQDRLKEAYALVGGLLELPPLGEYLPKQLSHLIRILIASERGEEACRLIAQGIQSEPQDPAILMETANWHWTHAALDSAEYYVRRAAERDPKTADIPFTLGRIVEARGDRERAQDYYEAALSLDSLHVGALDRLADLGYQAYGDRLLRLTTQEASPAQWPRGGEMGWNAIYELPMVLRSGAHQIVLEATGTPAGGIFPHLNISLVFGRTGKRTLLADFFLSRDVPGHIVSALIEEAGSYQLLVHFDNDGFARDAGGAVIEDRNAYLGKVTVRRLAALQ